LSRACPGTKALRTLGVGEVPGDFPLVFEGLLTLLTLLLLLAADFPLWT
jgi:hypothetical protein